MTRHFRAHYVAVSLILVGSLFGCTSTGSGVEVARGPEGLQIESVGAVTSGLRVSKNDETLKLDCEPLLVSVLPELDSDALGGEFLLASPGTCGSTVDCGWLVLSVLDEADEPIETVSTAELPIRVDLPNDKRKGKVTFHLELRDAAGKPVLTDDGETLATELAIALETDVDC